MPAKNVIHDAVKNALVKDGWTITDDPYVIEYLDLKLYADLGAERPLAAERGGDKILVEVKSFVGLSPMHDLHEALGQYQVYQSLLELTAPLRKAYLAVANTVYNDFICRDVIQVIVKRYQISFLVINLKTEEIEQWIS